MLLYVRESFRTDVVRYHMPINKIKGTVINRARSQSEAIIINRLVHRRVYIPFSRFVILTWSLGPSKILSGVRGCQWLEAERRQEERPAALGKLFEK
jgi:hypothetical protein